MNIIQVLNEGKKERLIDKFRSQLEPLGDEAIKYAEIIINNDPSLTKKYSEWGVKKFIDEINKPTSSVVGGGDPISVASIIWVNIKKYHDIVERLSPEKVDNMFNILNIEGNFSSESTEKKIRSKPKDITSFDTIHDLFRFVNKYEDYLDEIRTEKEVKKEVDRVYENDRFLIIRPLSHKSSCYYGASTKWCTTSTDNDDYFNRYTSRGKLYYIIDKKSSDRTYGKMALLVPHGNGTPEVYNQQDHGEKFSFLLERFAPIKEEINKLTERGDDYETLKKVKNNPKTSMYESLTSHFFDRFDGENAIFNFSNELKNYLDFMEDEVGEDAIGYYLWSYENPNGDFFYETSRFNDDMMEGYPLYVLTPEHIDILRSIVEIIEPELLEAFDGSEIKPDGDWDVKVSKFIENKLPKLYEDFGYLYSEAEDRSIHQGVIKYIEDEICNLYDEIGLTKVDDEGCFGQYKISIDKLIDIYEDNLDYNKDLSTEQVLENVIQQNIDLDTYFMDSVNEYQDLDVFNDSFNSDMTNLLENVLSDVESDDNVVSDVNEYRRILKYINNKFGLNTPHAIKSSESEDSIIFTGVNPKNSKINFEIINKDNEIKKGSAKLTTIIKLLNNYTLFDPF